MEQKTLYVGCDVSTGENHFAGILFNKKILFSCHFPNNIDGSDEIIRLIVKTMEEHNLSTVLFAVEATSNYHFHILNYFAASDKLDPYSTTLYQLNAALVKEHKKRYTKTSKTDKHDAIMIADFLRFGDLPEPYKPFDEYEPLKRLTRMRFHIIKSLETEYNYFLSQLYLKFSEYKNLPFSTLFGATSFSLLTDIQFEELVDMPEEKLVDFLVEKSRDKFENPEEMASSIKKLLRNCYRVNKKVGSAVEKILKISAQTIKGLKASLKEINNAIDEELNQFTCTLQSIPGIGKIYTACIIAEIGNKNFKDDSKLAKYAGLTWNQSQSGDFDSDETPLNKSGNTYLRYYLVEAANSVKTYCPEFAAFYAKKYKEVNKHQHKRALVLTARKLLRTIFILLRDNTLYDPSRRAKALGGGSIMETQL